MKALALALLFSLPVPRVMPPQPARQPSGYLAHKPKGGKWYFAENGHAVFCYGPVLTVTRANGDLQRVATFCRDGSAAVPLKD